MLMHWGEPGNRGGYPVERNALVAASVEIFSRAGAATR